MCFYLVGDGQVERSKNKQRVAKRSQKKQDWANHESMPRHGFAMLQHEVLQSKTRGCMLQHAQFIQQHAKAVQKQDFQDMPQHAQIMPRHDDDNQTMLFLASRVWDSYVILLSLLV